MNNKKIAAIIITSIFCFGCQKIIDPGDLPQQDVRLVANCILNTDSLIVANISLSKSILSGKNYQYVNNAICDLFENDVFKQTLANTGNGNYLSTVLAKSDSKYTIKVAASGYKSVEGTTTLLKNAVIKNLQRYDTINSDYAINDYGNDSYLNGETKYRLSIADDPGVKNYYGIRPIVFLYDSTGKLLNMPVNLSILNNVNTGDIFGGSSGGDGVSVYLDDQTLVNGNEVQADVNVSLDAGGTGNLNDISSIKILFAIYSLNEDYYRYKSTLTDQVNGGGLFAEPVRVYSNMSSGMGIIAGASVNTFSVYSKVLKH